LERDLLVAILETDVALAGLLLVFVGFVYSRGEELSSLRKAKFKNVARAGMIPFGLSLSCAWVCVSYLVGDAALARTAVTLFRLDLIVTAGYACFVLFAYL
jgi:hypothetical protein